MPTYAYLRVSSEIQAKADKDGLPRQREAILRFAVQNKLTVNQWFVEPGVSGSEDITERKALFDLLEVVQPGDTVLIDRLDRLARQVGIQEYVLLKLRKKKVTVTSTSPAEKADATDPMDIAIRQMFGVFAQLEAAMIQRRTQNARSKKREAWRRGEGPRCDGRKPYGEASDPRQRAVEEKGMKVIRLLAERGLGVTAIAAELNQMEVPTRTGRPWTGRTVWGIMQRERTV